MLLTRLARAEFSSPSKIRGSQLTITRQPLTAAASERFKELAQIGEHPQGYPGEGDAALFYRLEEKLLGQLHLQLKQVTAALPWTPSPAACKAPLRKSVSSRRKKKKHKASLFRTQGHCRTRGERRRAAGSKVPAEH